MKVLRLRENEGLVDPAILAAMKITLRPSAFSVTLAPEVITQVKDHVYAENTINIWKDQHAFVSEENFTPDLIGEIFSEHMISQLSSVSDRLCNNGYYIME